MHTCSVCGYSYKDNIVPALKKSIGSAKISLKYTSITYDPKGIKADKYLTIKDGSKTLVQDKDYTISYKNNKKVGYKSCTLTITGKGKYTGKAIKPAVTVKDTKGTKLTASSYTVAYSNNTKVGTATIKITGKGNYQGTITKKFVIKPKAGTLALTAGKKR